MMGVTILMNLDGRGILKICVKKVRKESSLMIMLGGKDNKFSFWDD